MSTNISLPPIQCYVDNTFLFFNQQEFLVSSAHLIGARSLQNQALQFSVLLDTGALYTGLPANAISFEDTLPQYSLQQACMWDNISSDIEFICYDTLRYMSCTVKLSDDTIVEGAYLFTIDYKGSNDLSRSAEHWKQSHVIKAATGEMLVYPQYKIKFTDTALCDNISTNMPNKHNKFTQIVGS